MSSWANHGIPRKRDISQIPESLRPQIVPRVLQPLIVSSESFQPKTDNAFVTTTSASSKKVEEKPYVNPRQYAVKQIESKSQPSAFELNYKEKSYVFVILRHLRNVRDNDLWISSYNSIRKYYKNKIIIIDDNSAINTVDGKLVNAEVIRSEFPGAGEILPYYYFLKYKWADRMIFLHDSMFINRPFRDGELDGRIKFHWSFSSNNTGDVRKISNYLSMLNNNTELQAYLTDNGTTWFGCFGAASVCDLAMVQYLDEEYNLFSRLVFLIRTRLDRETFERVLGIVLFYEGIFETSDCSNFGDILKYPGAFESENNNMETAQHIVGQRGYNTAIIKVWRGR